MKKIFFVFILFLSFNSYAQIDGQCNVNFTRISASNELNLDYFQAGFNPESPSYNVIRLLVGNFSMDRTDEIFLFRIPLFGLGAEGGSRKGSIYNYCADDPVGLKRVWIKGDGSLFEYWTPHERDIHVVGNLNGHLHNKKDEILMINPSNGWAGIKELKESIPACVDSPIEGTNTSWRHVWGNGGNGMIGSWPIEQVGIEEESNDYYFIDDFDGDINNGDELLCVNTARPEWKLFNYLNGYFIELAAGDQYFGGTTLTNTVNHRTITGKFVSGDTRAMVFNPEYTDVLDVEKHYSLISFNFKAVSGTVLVEVWNNWPDKKIGYKGLEEHDLFYSGNFDGIEQDELIRFNREWRFEMYTSEFRDFNDAIDIGDSQVEEYPNFPGSGLPNLQGDTGENFHINGRVDFINYETHNPKYHEYFLPFFGDFIADGRGSLVIIAGSDPGLEGVGGLRTMVDLYDVDLGLGVNWLTGNPSTTEYDVLNKRNENPIKQKFGENKILFPNPANTVLNFSAQPIDVKIYSSNGSLLLRDKLTNQIDISFLPEGFYVAKVEYKEGWRIEKFSIIR